MYFILLFDRILSEICTKTLHTAVQNRVKLYYSLLLHVLANPAHPLRSNQSIQSLLPSMCASPTLPPPPPLRITRIGRYIKGKITILFYCIVWNMVCYITVSVCCVLGSHFL
jgi:hypothetical protein